jgi:hypothetical protein
VAARTCHNRGMAAIIILLVLAIISYLISLSRHPRGRACRKCGGSGVHRGLIFRYAIRDCTRCGGRPGRARIGIRILRPGHLWGERVPAEAAAKRAENWGR